MSSSQEKRDELNGSTMHQATSTAPIVEPTTLRSGNIYNQDRDQESTTTIATANPTRSEVDQFPLAMRIYRYNSMTMRTLSSDYSLSSTSLPILPRLTINSSEDDSEVSSTKSNGTFSPARQSYSTETSGSLRDCSFADLPALLDAPTNSNTQSALRSTRQSHLNDYAVAMRSRRQLSGSAMVDQGNESDSSSSASDDSSSTIASSINPSRTSTQLDPILASLARYRSVVMTSSTRLSGGSASSNPSSSFERNNRSSSSALSPSNAPVSSQSPSVSNVTLSHAAIHTNGDSNSSSTTDNHNAASTTTLYSTPGTASQSRASIQARLNDILARLRSCCRRQRAQYLTEAQAEFDSIEIEEYQPLTTFYLFTSPRMPFDIQNRIWSFAVAASPPRVVDLRTRKLAPRGQRNKNGQKWDYKSTYTSGAPIPALLHVCRRSRDVAMNRWTLGFKKSSGGNQKHWKGKARAWFDFEMDTLLLGAGANDTTRLPMDRFIGGVEVATLAKIKNIAFSFVDWGQAMELQPAPNSIAGVPRFFHDLMARFPALEVLRMFSEERRGVAAPNTIPVASPWLLYGVLRGTVLSSQYSLRVTWAPINCGGCSRHWADIQRMG